MDDLSLSDDLSDPSTKGLGTPFDAHERGNKGSPQTATKKSPFKAKGSPNKKEKQAGHVFEVQDLGQLLGELDTNLNAKTLNQLHNTLDG